MNRACEFCGKKLVRHKIKNNARKRGWHWETLKNYYERRMCNRSCWAKLRVKLQGKTIWNKKLLKNYFKGIKDIRKYRLHWLKENHKKLPSAIAKLYGKNYWKNFLIDIGKLQKLGADKTNPKYRKIASKLLKYWQQELDIKVGNSFEYSQYYGLPIDGYENELSGTIYKSLQYLRKLHAIKLLKNGRYGKGTGNSEPSRYKLLKVRI